MRIPCGWAVCQLFRAQPNPQATKFNLNFQVEANEHRVTRIVRVRVRLVSRIHPSFCSQGTAVLIKNGESRVTSLEKNNIVLVDGRLQSRKYQGSDGVTREVVEILATRISAPPEEKLETSANEA